MSAVIVSVRTSF